MTNFTVAQHFFSSVPAEQSPRHRRGYQTLFHTRGLSDEIIQAVEDRAQYSAAQGKLTKRQFYPLPQNLMAVAQIIPLQELDEFGRRGRYLAHTLIFSSQNLQELGGCPLDIFGQVHFATSLEEVYRIGQMKNSEAPRLNISVTPAWLTLAHAAMQRWPVDMLEQLGRLTWQAEALLKERESVSLLGTESEQWETLALFFALASPAMRSQLSFDTYAADCVWAPDVAFWLQGYPNDMGVRSVHKVSISACKIGTTLSAKDDNTFANWMTEIALQTRPDLGDLQKKQLWACTLQSVIAGEVGYLNINISSDFLVQFATLHREAIAQRWFTCLPEGLSEDLLNPIRADINHDPAAYLQMLIEGIETETMQDIIFSVVARLRREPSRADQRRIKKWLIDHPHTGLTAMLALWEQNSKAWLEALRMLSREDYRWLVQQLLGWQKLPLSLWEMLVTPYGADWLQLAGAALPPEEWKKVLPIMTQLNDPMLPRLLVEVFPRLPAASRKIITDWLKKNRATASHLAEALGLKETEKKRGFRLFG